MTALIPIVAIGLLGGIAIGLQGPFSSMIGQRLGILEGVFIIHLGGAIAALIPLVMMGGGKLAAWTSLPWYVVSGGIMGLVVVSAISYLIPHIGAASAMLLIIAGQLLTGSLLDHFGAFGLSVRPIDLQKLGGLIIVFLGVWLIVKP
ncbi:MAG: transporter family-2 protein [Halieaceae bacterium]|jgi:transporter family-2 protein